MGGRERAGRARDLQESPAGRPVDHLLRRAGCTCTGTGQEQRLPCPRQRAQPDPDGDGRLNRAQGRGHHGRHEPPGDGGPRPPACGTVRPARLYRGTRVRGPDFNS